MKKIFFTGIIFCLILFSCERKTQEVSNAKSISNTEDNIYIDTSSGAYKVVNNFYFWYISNYTKENKFILIPNIQVNDSVYSLDSTSYIKKLEKLNFFSNGFIEKEKNLVSGCNFLIRKYDWKGDSELDFEGCDFMSYDRWIGGQGESIDGFKITSVIKTSDTFYTVIVESLIEGSKYISLTVGVLHSDSIYKIDNISFN